MARYAARKMAVRLTVLVAALVVVLAGVAYASIPGPDGVIHGCRKNTDGSLRVVDSTASCPSGFTALNWNQGGLHDYEVVSAEFALIQPSGGSDQRVSGSVHCPSGKLPMGGGTSIRASDSTFLLTERVQFSFPSADGWDGQISYPSNVGTLSGGDAFIVYAICSFAS